MYFHYPFPGLVFKEWLDECVQRVNVPWLVDKMDSSKASRETVLWQKETPVSKQSWPEVTSRTTAIKSDQFLLLGCSKLPF